MIHQLWKLALGDLKKFSSKVSQLHVNNVCFIEKTPIRNNNHVYVSGT